MEIDKREVFHRDIKLGNILISGSGNNSRAILIDFGSGATFKPGQKFYFATGTPQYYSPEMFRREPYKPEPTTVWQLGLVLYSMLTGRRLPWSEEVVASYREMHLPRPFPYGKMYFILNYNNVCINCFSN